jgi:uncharacterized protein YcfL
MADKKKVARESEQLLLVEDSDPSTNPSIESEEVPSETIKPKKVKKKSKKKKKRRKVVKKYYYDDDSNCLDDLFESVYDCLVGWWRD